MCFLQELDLDVYKRQVPAYAQSSEPQPETAPAPAETEAEPETQNPFTPDGTGTVDVYNPFQSGPHTKKAVSFLLAIPRWNIR